MDQGQRKAVSSRALWGTIHCSLLHLRLFVSDKLQVALKLVGDVGSTKLLQFGCESACNLENGAVMARVARLVAVCPRSRSKSENAIPASRSLADEFAGSCRRWIVANLSLDNKCDRILRFGGLVEPLEFQVVIPHGPVPVKWRTSSRPNAAPTPVSICIADKPAFTLERWFEAARQSGGRIQRSLQDLPRAQLHWNCRPKRSYRARIDVSRS